MYRGARNKLSKTNENSYREISDLNTASRAAMHIL